MVHFANFTKAERTALNRVLDRAQKTDLPRFVIERTKLTMDLSAVHFHTPLDLEKLADFPEFDFAHDLLGIHEHLDRNTGKLTDCFLPRCSKPRSN